MANLIQYKNKDEVLRIFREAIAGMMPNLNIRFQETVDQENSSRYTFQICTANNSYGYLIIEGNLENETIEHLQNATQMLGMILENINQHELLGNQKAHLEETVQEKTKELQEAEYNYRQMFERSVDGIMLTDPTTGHIIEANPMMCSLLGMEYKDVIGHHHTRFYLPEYQDIAEELFIKHKEQDPDDTPQGPEEIIFEHPDGNLIATEVRTQLINYGDKKVHARFFRDITKRKGNEERIRQSERKLSTLLANLPGMAYQCYNDENWSMLFLSQGCLELTEYNPDYIQHNKKLSYGDLILPEDKKYVWENVQNNLKHKKPFTITYRIKTRGGRIKWVWERGRRIKTDNKGNEILEGIISDITQQKQYEQAIKNSLEEKKTLLKEIHHRVKNNLSIITSLLKLQSDTLSLDNEGQEALKETYSQIQSMAQVHEQLYQSNDFSSIDMNHYIETLISRLNQANRNTSQIEFQLETDQIFLDINSAIPCGLIINELVTNSIKHAFTSTDKGTINIILTRNNYGNILLKVADDGKGLPDGFEINNVDSLGLELVNMLVKQLKAELRVENRNGSAFEIIMPTTT